MHPKVCDLFVDRLDYLFKDMGNKLEVIADGLGDMLGRYDRV